MKFKSARFAKDQDLQREEMGEIELSSAELESVCGGGSCPESNGFPYDGSSYQGVGNSYDGSSYQGVGNSYGGFPDNGYAGGYNQLPPCIVPPPPCPYSY